MHGTPRWCAALSAKTNADLKCYLNISALALNRRRFFRTVAYTQLRESAGGLLPETPPAETGGVFLSGRLGIGATRGAARVLIRPRFQPAGDVGRAKADRAAELKRGGQVAARRPAVIDGLGLQAEQLAERGRGQELFHFFVPVEATTAVASMYRNDLPIFVQNYEKNTLVMWNLCAKFAHETP